MSTRIAIALALSSLLFAARLSSASHAERIASAAPTHTCGRPDCACVGTCDCAHAICCGADEEPTRRVDTAPAIPAQVREAAALPPDAAAPGGVRLGPRRCGSAPGSAAASGCAGSAGIASEILPQDEIRTAPRRAAREAEEIPLDRRPAPASPPPKRV